MSENEEPYVAPLNSIAVRVWFHPAAMDSAAVQDRISSEHYDWRIRNQNDLLTYQFDWQDGQMRVTRRERG